MLNQSSEFKFLKAHLIYCLQDFLLIHMQHLVNRLLSIRYRLAFKENSCYEQFLAESKHLKCYAYFSKVKTLNPMIQLIMNAHFHPPPPYFLPLYVPATHKALDFESLPQNSARGFALFKLFLLYIEFSLPLICRSLEAYLW
jgi:hypothetical protein